MHPRPLFLLRTSSRRSARGFTLIELLVAIVAGLFVSMAAFALSKQGSRFFHQETRVANAQFASIVGFERLRADIARAGYLSTPNLQTDPFHCISPTINSWPDGLRFLSALRIDQGAPVQARSAANSLNPDRILLTGSYTTDELFPVRAVQSGAGNGDRIYLNETFGPMQRLLQRAGAATGADRLSVLQDVFASGRAIRILDQSGGVSFGIIQVAQFDGANPVVILKRETELPFITGGGSRCGIAGNETGAQLSVINWISYELDTLALDGVPGDETALQLVRRELDFASESADNPTSLGPAETVAELAVDLKFGITYLTGPGLNPSANTMLTLGYGDEEIGNVAGAVTASSTSVPHRIRSVRARLSVRSREGDRLEDISPESGGGMVGAPLFRYKLPNDTYARVRTMGAEIQLPNFAEVSW